MTAPTADNAAFGYVIDAYKTRSALNAVLFTAFLTANGYAFAGEEEAKVFFVLAGLVPVLAFVSDIITKYTYISPLLYKALDIEFRHSDAPQSDALESLPFLFTDFGRGERSRYAKLFRDMQAGPKRQHRFRRLYVFRNMPFKILFFGSFSLIDFAFAAGLQHRSLIADILSLLH